ncbi:DofB protein [Hyalangium rubrum]|uniref:DofB protein n=1 Tax=Hyalangium rubrum TaxID=3103134 RepID=A0ABU5HI74_9BACT|nr:DofB protein [Hyalangium sp. s54d21]MDY7233168.1 DofB protein [Hyalangium sp. s54d21]
MTAGVRIDLIDRVLFARWVSPPTKEDVNALLTQSKAIRDRLGRPILYVASIDSKVKIPNAEERANLNHLLSEGRPIAEACHIIIEGNDLQNSLQRVIISGMLIVTRTYDDFLAVHKSAESVAPELARRLGKDAAPIIRLARERGLVT